MFPGDKDVQLCVGSQVMLTTDWEGVPRGARGQVEGFQDQPAAPHMCFPLVRFPGYGDPRVVRYHLFPARFDYRFGRVSCERIPLVEAYAMTLFKVQGTTMARVTADLTHDLRRPGQAYTALGRLATREGLVLAEHDVAQFDAKSFQPLPAVDKFYASLKVRFDVHQMTEKHSLRVP